MVRGIAGICSPKTFSAHSILIKELCLRSFISEAENGEKNNSNRPSMEVIKLFKRRNDAFIWSLASLKTGQGQSVFDDLMQCCRASRHTCSVGDARLRL